MEWLDMPKTIKLKMVLANGRKNIFFWSDKTMMLTLEQQLLFFSPKILAQIYLPYILWKLQI